MIKPAPRLLIAVIGISFLWLLWGIVRIYIPPVAIFWPIPALATGALALLALADTLSARRLKVVRARRAVKNTLAVGTRCRYRISVKNPLAHALKLSIYDHIPPSFISNTEPPRLTLPGQQSAEVEITCTPVHRGDAIFPALDLVMATRLGFWQVRRRVPDEDRVRIYPDFASLVRLSGLEHDQKSAQLGIHLQQRRGEGQEFRQLRDFRRGDSLRCVDWKATSRLQKLIARDYQDERDQEVLFLLDTGIRMHSKEQGLSHFDQSLNALILLAYVALKKGDRVGIMTFAGNKTWLPPVSGQNAMAQILRSVYALHSTTQTPDYLNAARTLLARQNRRSLVVLISNVSGEQTDDLLAAVSLLRKKHLVITANLREQYLDNALSQPVQNFQQALIYTGVCQYRAERTELLQKLKARGVRLLDANPKELASGLVNQYLSMKRAGAL